MLPPSQSQQASRLHSRSEITLLNRDEVRELTPITAAAAHQDRGLAVRKAIRFQMLAIEKFNTFYHAQALKYESEIYPTAHTAIPDLILDDELASSSAAAVPALPIDFNLSNNFISEDSSRVGPGEAPLEAPGSQTVGALTMLPPSQGQQASRLHSRSEITLLNRDEVRELTPIAAAAVWSA